MTEGASQLSAQAQAREDPHNSQRHSVGHRPTRSASAHGGALRNQVTLAAAERDQEAVCGSPNAQNRVPWSALRAKTAEQQRVLKRTKATALRAQVATGGRPSQCPGAAPKVPRSVAGTARDDGLLATYIPCQENRKSPFKSIQFHSNRFSSRAL
jgi:hypothetical protein